MSWVARQARRAFAGTQLRQADAIFQNPLNKLLPSSLPLTSLIFTSSCSDHNPDQPHVQNGNRAQLGNVNRSCMGSGNWYNPNNGHMRGPTMMADGTAR